jgi:hypothetical protein
LAVLKVSGFPIVLHGFRFGLALGMEAHYPEIFGEYERLDVDCVLFSSTGSANPGGPQTFVTEVQGYAAAHSYWVGFSVRHFSAATNRLPAQPCSPGHGSGTVAAGSWHDPSGHQGHEQREV